MSDTKYEQMTFEFETRPPIKGYPELHWTGKRPYKSTVYYPAQLKETYGEAKDVCPIDRALSQEFEGRADILYALIRCF